MFFSHIKLAHYITANLRYRGKDGWVSMNIPMYGKRIEVIQALDWTIDLKVAIRWALIQWFIQFPHGMLISEFVVFQGYITIKCLAKPHFYKACPRNTSWWLRLGHFSGHLLICLHLSEICTEISLLAGMRNSDARSGSSSNSHEGIEASVAKFGRVIPKKFTETTSRMLQLVFFPIISNFSSVSWGGHPPVFFEG